MPFSVPSTEREEQGFSTPEHELEPQGFTAPPADMQANAEAWTHDPSFNPEVHAAQHPEDADTAFTVRQAKDSRPMGQKIAETIPKIPSMIGGAATGVGKFFLGAGLTPLHGAAQFGLNMAAPVLRAAGAGNLATSAEDEAFTQGAEATLAGEGVEQNIRGDVHALKQWIPGLKDDPRADFDNRVQAARNELQLAEGRPIDTGVVAAASRAITGQKPSEAFSPEVVAATGSRPASLGLVDMMRTTGDPTNLLLAAAPGLPGAKAVGGAFTELAGKAMQLPGRAVSYIPGKIGKFGRLAEGGSGAAAIAASVFHPEAAAVAGGTVAASKGLQWLGKAWELQGEATRKGIPSALDTQLATARVAGENVPYGTLAQKRIGDFAANAASTAAGMIPANLALSEGDPEKFAQSEVQAGAFGGLMGAFRSSRPALVEAARPYLRSEGARNLADMMQSGDPLAQRSAAFIQTLPEEAQHQIFETLGLLSGMGAKTPTGDTKPAKVYVLSGTDYQQALQNVPPDQRPTGQSRGFFYRADGSAFINGQSPSNIQPGELNHTIGHELGGHAALNILQAAGSKGGAIYDGLMSEVRKGLLTPKGQPTDAFQKFIDSYNRAFDPTGQTKRLDASNPAAMEEWIAETAGQIMANGGAADIALPKTMADRIGDGASRFMGRLTGADPRKLAGKPKFDREDLPAITEAVRDSLSQIAGMKLREGQGLPQEQQSAAARIAELNEILAKPKPVNPTVDEAKAYYTEKRAAMKEMQQLSESSQPPFPAAGQAPVPPSAPAVPIAPTSPTAPTAPAAPNLAKVAAALRLQGIPSAEAHQWAAVAQGDTLEAMVVDALRQRAEKKFAQPGTQINAPAPQPVSSIPAVAPAPSAAPGVATAVSEPAPAPAGTPQTLTRESLKQIGKDAADQAEAEVRANRTTRQKEHTLQPQIDKARAKAEFEAMAKAHAASLPANSDLAHWQVDRFGNGSVVGKTVDPNDPFHAELVERAGLDPQSIKTLDQLHAAMDTPVGIEYLSAPESAGAKANFGEMSPQQVQELRRKAQAESTASERAAGESPIRRVAKSFIPEGFKFWPSGTVTVSGFSPDKVLANAGKLLQWLAQKGIAPFSGVNDPLIIQDLNGMAANHKANFLGNGMRPAEGTPLTTVRADQNYQPYVIPQERFDVLNALLGDTSAGELNEEGKPKRTTPERTEKQVLARLNSPFVNPETGEVNRIRELMDKEGDFSFTDAQGEQHTGKNVLENAWESLRPELIEKIGPPDIRNEHTIRPSDFTGNLGDITGTPRHAFAASGFMPEEYHIPHRPNSEGPPASDLLRGELAPRDIYEHPEYYTGDPSSLAFKQTISTLRKIKGNPNAQITIFRASPKNELNHGDWVSLSRNYAKQHGMADDPNEDVPVQVFKVRASDIRWAGDDLAEFGYFPEKSQFMPAESRLDTARLAARERIAARGMAPRKKELAAP